MPPPLLQAVSSETFERDVLQADRPVLVDFWVSYCSVCCTMDPVLEALIVFVLSNALRLRRFAPPAVGGEDASPQRRPVLRAA